ncbi:MULTISPECIES: hypothetical protein [unclassified Mesorhizobium]|uniref:hypothetical protein n=1 Tax=unclassified Mesorhizobium TaxID=325217 RepID=UPI000FCCD881|nr:MULTISPECIES: hypothetical protein [unclassified Mesorhizobium]TGP23660.1 hypothetical protein EN874_014070 [Mesorhizobium sp. M1D.F.Ca.ET.231.01.1.1]TGP33804.1 hypothetical protein EN877_14075 [Mesorhizobium sp. M1D.F.Ca.ET.234.01.1.1]TGS47170.1 hypothetical protein EN827_14070 [Mesorhizobium sp. M1D.F.Ca.ET.184.01.1.1]TGS62428.1 hypothetical protein EN826_014070 [Mesorhizobium sp. M1D.F.Ca.ET.183.01.1.1]
MELFRAYPGAHLKINRGSPAAVIDALKSGDVELAIAGPLGQASDRLDVWPLFQEAMELAYPYGRAPPAAGYEAGWPQRRKRGLERVQLSQNR